MRSASISGYPDRELKEDTQITKERQKAAGGLFELCVNMEKRALDGGNLGCFKLMYYKEMIHLAYTESNHTVEY